MKYSKTVYKCDVCGIEHLEGADDSRAITIDPSGNLPDMCERCLEIFSISSRFVKEDIQERYNLFVDDIITLIDIIGRSNKVEIVKMFGQASWVTIEKMKHQLKDISEKLKGQLSMGHISEGQLSIPIASQGSLSHFAEVCLKINKDNVLDILETSSGEKEV